LSQPSFNLVVSLLLLSWHVLQEVHRSEETRTLEHDVYHDV
jgi:hypothetical protein